MPRNHFLICLVVAVLLGAPAGAADRARAGLERLRASAAKGDARAQRELGDYLYGKDGGTADDAEAAEWYRRAAEQGNAAAQY